MKKLTYLLLIISLPLICNGQKEVKEYFGDINFKDILERKGLIYTKADTSLVTGRVIRYNKKNVAKKYILVSKGKPDNLGWVRFKDKVVMPKESALGSLLSIPVSILDENNNYYNRGNNNINETEYNINKTEYLMSRQSEDFISIHKDYKTRVKDYTSKAYQDGLERNDIDIQLNSSKIIVNKNFEKRYQNGQISKKGKYEDDNLNGGLVEYYENGQLKSKRNYSNGKLNGEWEEYYENGQLKSKRNYKDAKPIGEWIEYYDDGQLKSKRNYNKNGNLHGEWLEYYAKGQLKSKRTYKDANLIGYWIEYDENGHIIKMD